MLCDEERLWFETTRDSYLGETSFELTSDLRDLDRLLTLELMIYRWSMWVSAGQDYDGQVVDYGTAQKTLTVYGTEVNKLKTAMGLTKAARDSSEGSIGGYIIALKQRAKAFGVHREQQVTKAIALLQEIFALVATRDRADEEERRKLGLESPEDIVKWIRDVARAEYDQLDVEFRKHQTYWLRQI